MGKTRSLNVWPPSHSRSAGSRVDHLLVRLARLLALDELALHQLAVDLERETGHDRAVREGQAERPLQAVVGVVAEHVLDAGLGHVAGRLRRDVDPLDRQARHRRLLAVRLERAFADEDAADGRLADDHGRDVDHAGGRGRSGAADSHGCGEDNDRAVHWAPPARSLATVTVCCSAKSRYGRTNLRSAGRPSSSTTTTSPRASGNDVPCAL